MYPSIVINVPISACETVHPDSDALGELCAIRLPSEAGRLGRRIANVGRVSHNRLGEFHKQLPADASGDRVEVGARGAAAEVGVPLHAPAAIDEHVDVETLEADRLGRGTSGGAGLTDDAEAAGRLVDEVPNAPDAGGEEIPRNRLGHDREGGELDDGAIRPSAASQALATARSDPAGILGRIGDPSKIVPMRFIEVSPYKLRSVIVVAPKQTSAYTLGGVRALLGIPTNMMRRSGIALFNRAACFGTSS